MPNHNHNALLTPYQLGDLNLRNRIVMAPLTRTRAENAGHIPNDLMVEYDMPPRRRGLAHRMRKKLNQLVEPFHAFQRCLRRSR